jgi:peroxiredoxin
MGRLLFWMLLSLCANAQSLSGLWSASVKANDLEIPFRFEISGEGSSIKGSFFNGEQKVTSNSGSFAEGKLLLRFDFYNSKLEAEWKQGALDGAYTRDSRVYPFHAIGFVPPSLEGSKAPRIAGLWDIAVKSSKGELAWRFIVRQSGPEVTAAILRVDGDTGTLEGSWRDGKFVLSHFDGARPLLLEVAPQPDGTLIVKQNGRDPMTAVRSTQARAQGLPEPADPSRHTSMKDPTEPLHFGFPDLAGKMVSDTDYRGKVVIVAIGGSWCPNCHDEAPFLVELYRKYHARGLEIVDLSFEEGDQLKDPTRLRAFVKKYGIPYPVLVAGEPSELNAKLPQAVNLNAWPTTFFLGRDGRVRSVHAGFAAKASGEFHEELKTEVAALLERLLKE